MKSELKVCDDLVYDLRIFDKSNNEHLAHSLGLIFTCGSDSSVHVKSCVAPPQDLLHKREVYKLFTKKQGEDLPVVNHEFKL